MLNPGQRNFTSVATYFAEVPTEVAGAGTFYDLANVQVLKGPQGTLFGRNTTGGAVLFEPARPDFEFAGYVKATLGNYDTREGEAVLNLPIIDDRLAIRLAGNIARRDGYTQSVRTGQKLDGRHYEAWRVSVLARPFDGLENLLILDGRRKDQSGTSAVLRQVNPALPVGQALTPLLAEQVAIGPRKTTDHTPPTDARPVDPQRASARKSDAPLATRTPRFAGAPGCTTPLVSNRLTIRLVVFPYPTFFNTNPTTTASPGSIRLLDGTHCSSTTAALSSTKTGSVFTTTVKVFVALKGGSPLSETTV